MKPRLVVDLRHVVEARLGIAGIGKGLVRMAEQQDIDVGLLGQIPVRVLHRVGIGARVDAAMRHGDDDIGAFGAQRRRVSSCRLDDAERAHLALELEAVPEHDRRRRETDDADADRHLARPLPSASRARGSSASSRAVGGYSGLSVAASITLASTSGKSGPLHRRTLPPPLASGCPVTCSRNGRP